MPTKVIPILPQGAGHTFKDNTEIGCYKDCPRRHLLRHVLHWRAAGVARPLVFGLCWHDAMDVVWSHYKKVDQRELLQLAFARFCQTWQENGFPVDMTLEQIEEFTPRTPMIAAEMLAGYIADRGKIISQSELVGTEQPFCVPVPGVKDGWYIGRLDKAFDLNGQTIIAEHKTTTEYKKEGGFKTLYIEGWYNDAQVKGYHFGGSLYYPSLGQIWVDCALVHKTVHDKFRFVPVQHPAPIINEWLEDLQNWWKRIVKDQQILEEEGHLVGGIFPKNENQCVGKFGACQFLDLCRTVADPTQLGEPPEGYIEEKWEPFKLLGLDKVISNE